MEQRTLEWLALQYCTKNRRIVTRGVPNLAGLEVFKIHLGERVITVALFPENYFQEDPSAEEVLEEVLNRNLENPSIEIVRQVRAVRSHELAERQIVGVCGVVSPYGRGFALIDCIFEDDDGGIPRGCRAHTKLQRKSRFLAAVSEE